MSIRESKHQNNLSDSYYEPNDEPQDEEMLLETSQSRKNLDSQGKHKITLVSKPKSIQLQKDNQTLSKNENHETYMRNEHAKINSDVQDYNDLQAEIQRLQQIKNQYKEQKESIERLSKAVENLQCQNRSLKLQKQSNRDDSTNKKFLSQAPQNAQSAHHQKYPGKRILNQNTIKGNLFNKNPNSKKVNMSHEGLYLSPQSHRRISSNSVKNLQANPLNNQETYVNDMIRIDQEIMIKHHQHNKKSVIASFVEELKYELEQNQAVLQRQKKAHRDTKQKLQACLGELNHLRSLIDRQKNVDYFERENSQLRKQLQKETELRLLAEERLREKQMILSQFEYGFSTRGSEFDRELDRMDEIYFSIERTLKL